MALDDDNKPLKKLSEAFESLANTINTKNPEQSPLELAPFCQACYLVSPLFQYLGFAFKFADIDYVSKIDDLLEASKSISTLEAMIDRDIKQNCAKKVSSHTRNLLLVKRGLDSVKVLFENILASEEKSIRNPALKAYGKVFAPYHGWAIRKAVTAAIYAVPGRAQLLKRINEDETSAISGMQTYVTGSALVISYIENLFLSRELSID